MGVSSQVRANCYNYTLTRTAGSASVRAKATAPFFAFVTTGGTPLSGKICYTGTLTMYLEKASSTSNPSGGLTLNINGVTSSFISGDVGDAYLSNWYRKGPIYY